MVMLYEPLALCCECGQPADSITEVGLTPGHQLAVHWRCSACHKPVYFFKALADCWRACPPGPDSSVAEAAENTCDIQAADFALLSSMGITPSK
jgi:hypothetical protein